MSSSYPKLSETTILTTTNRETAAVGGNSNYSSKKAAVNYRPSYLPACWDGDEERMSSLMSMFKRREVNPTEYDAKLRFWSGLIASSGSQLKDPFFTMKQLSHRFQREDRVPACLDTVLRHMWSRRTIVPAREYMAGQQRRAAGGGLGGAAGGWISWGIDAVLVKPFSWVWGSAAAAATGATTGGGNNKDELANEEFVLPGVVQEIAEEVLRRRKEALDQYEYQDEYYDHRGDQSSTTGNPLCQDVVPFSSLHRIFRRDPVNAEWNGLSERALDAALDYLRAEGQVAVETVANAGPTGRQKMIKFKSFHEPDAPRMTEIDRQMLNVKHSARTLERDMSTLDEQVQRLDREARLYVRAGNRSKAMMCLRQKKQLVKRLNEKETAYDNLTSIMNQLAQTREQRTILDAYKSGVAAFKGNLASHGLSPEAVDKTMDDVQEALSDHEDIRAALSVGIGGIGGQLLDSSQEDLEQELNDLLEQEDKEQKEKVSAAAIKAKSKKASLVPPLPDVPSFEDDDQAEGAKGQGQGGKKGQGQSGGQEKEDRLKRLRRALEAS